MVDFSPCQSTQWIEYTILLGTSVIIGDVYVPVYLISEIHRIEKMRYRIRRCILQRPSNESHRFDASDIRSGRKEKELLLYDS